MTEKTDVEMPCVQLAKKRGYVSYKFDRPGGLKGWPDRAFWGDKGRHFLVEFKAPAGRLSLLQRHYKRKFIGSGHSYYVIRSVEEFDRILKAELG